MLQFDLAKIKDYLGISQDFTDSDEKLQNLFDYITPECKNFIGFDLSATTYTDEIHLLPHWIDGFQTKAFPLIQPESGDIVTVKINDEEIDFDNLIYDLDGNIKFKNNLILYRGYPTNTIKVTYQAGFTTFPSDVESKIYKLIKNEYFDGGDDIQSSSDHSSSETKRELIANLPVDVYRVWNRYRRNVL